MPNKQLEVKSVAKDLASEIHSAFASAYAINESVSHEWLKNIITQIIALAEKRGAEGERERMVRWVNENAKEFRPADNVWFGDDEYKVGEYKLVPTKDGMYCFNCERFTYEEGCICGYFWKDKIIKAITQPPHEQ